MKMNAGLNHFKDTEPIFYDTIVYTGCSKKKLMDFKIK